MKRFDVFVRTRRGGREPAGFVARGRSYEDAAAHAAEILRVPVDIVHLEVVH